MDRFPSALTIRPVAAGAPTSSLTSAQRQFVALLQRVRYGRFPRLPVRAGQPVLGPSLHWIRRIKVTGANDPHPAAGLDDFAMRAEVAAFLTAITRIGDGEVLNLEVRDGLPAVFEVEESYLG